MNKYIEAIKLLRKHKPSWQEYCCGTIELDCNAGGYAIELGIEAMKKACVYSWNNVADVSPPTSGCYLCAFKNNIYSVCYFNGNENDWEIRSKPLAWKYIEPFEEG